MEINNTRENILALTIEEIEQLAQINSIYIDIDEQGIINTLGEGYYYSYG